MPDKSKGHSHILKELRRRKVLRSLAIYAGTAFIILEACSLIFPRWGLPDWSIDLVLWEEYAKDNYIRPINMAVHLYRAEAYEKNLDKLEKALAMHEPNLPYIGTGTRYEALHDSARTLAILDQMGLPHPKK